MAQIDWDLPDAWKLLPIPAFWQRRDRGYTTADYLTDLHAYVDDWNAKHYHGKTWWDVHKSEFDRVTAPEAPLPPDDGTVPWSNGSTAQAKRKEGHTPQNREVAQAGLSANPSGHNPSGLQLGRQRGARVCAASASNKKHLA